MLDMQKAKQLCEEADALMYEAKAASGSGNGYLVAEATELYMEAAQLDPQSARPYIGIAYITYKTGRYMESMGLLAQAKDLEPYNNKINVLLARLDKALSDKFKNKPPPAELRKIRSLRQNMGSDKKTANLMAFKNKPSSLKGPEASKIEAGPKQEMAPGISQLLGPPTQKGCVSEGPQISLLQKALVAKGFPIVINGKFDKKTFKALQTFQFKLKLPVSGTTDPKTMGFINKILKDIYANPELLKQAQERRQKQQELAQQKQAGETAPDTKVDVPENPTQIYSELGPAKIRGKVGFGPEVQLLQETLQSMDFDVELNWEYDQKTTTAVRSFQMRHRLPLTGFVDAKTRQVLNPLVQISIRRKELAEELWEIVESHRHDTQQPTTGIWKLLIQHGIQEALGHCEVPIDEEQEDTTSAPKPSEKPLIDKVLGTKGLAGITSEGLQVQRAQEILQAKGYDLRVTGVFDLQTLTAVRVFIQDHNLGNIEVLDNSAWPILNDWLKARYKQERAHEKMVDLLYGFRQFLDMPWTNHLDEITQQVTLDTLMLKDLPEIESDLGPKGRMGMTHKGLEVAVFQFMLSEQGYLGELTSVFDAATQKALREYQKAQELPPSGLVEKSTLEHFNQLIENWEPSA